MPKTATKKTETENEEAGPEEVKIVERLVRARHIAHEVFGDSVSREIVFDVCDRLPLDDDGDEDADGEAELLADLQRCCDMTKAAFEADTVEAAEVLRTFDMLEDERHGDEDDEDDDE